MSCGRLVVLAGGASTRMRRSLERQAGASGELARQAAERTKGFIGVGVDGRPLLDYLIDNAWRAGVRDLVIVTAEGDRALRSYYARVEEQDCLAGLRVRCVEQRVPPGRATPAGTADALAQALEACADFRGAQTLVCNSDNLYSAGAMAALEALDGGGCIAYDMAALGFGDERLAAFGLMETDDEGYLTGIAEKPGLEVLLRLRAAGRAPAVSMNLWRLDSDLLLPFLHACPPSPGRDEKELPVAVGRMLRAHPRSIRAVPRAEPVPDLTSMEDIDAMRRFIGREYGALRWTAA